MPNPERLATISRIIAKAGRVLRLPMISVDQIAETAEDWDEILTTVPTAEIESLYVGVMSSRSVRGALQPQELLEMYRAHRAGGYGSTHRADCGLCDGGGWQILAVHCPTLSRDYTKARPCGCSNAKHPREPKRPPAWSRGDDGAWYPSDAENALRCTCFGCEETGKFARASLRFDSDPEALPRRL